MSDEKECIYKKGAFIGFGVKFEKYGGSFVNMVGKALKKPEFDKLKLIGITSQHEMLFTGILAVEHVLTTTATVFPLPNSYNEQIEFDILFGRLRKWCMDNLEREEINIDEDKLSMEIRKQLLRVSRHGLEYEFDRLSERAASFWVMPYLVEE